MPRACVRRSNTPDMAASTRALMMTAGALLLAGVLVAYELWRIPAPLTFATAPPSSSLPPVASLPAPAPPPLAAPAIPSPSLPAPPHAAAPTLSSQGGDAVDPCAPVVVPRLPDGFAAFTPAGVTVAWDPRLSPEPSTLAYLTAGLLAQIAAETGTAPRRTVTVIVYATLEDFYVHSGAPRWASAGYDGAVHLPSYASSDLGIALRSLRHELVHAQLHAAVGCTPIWLDEGLAQWFADSAPDREWLRMLGEQRTLDPRALAVPTAAAVHAERPEQVYATSLAMLLYALDRGDTVAALVADRRGARMDLWTRRYPAAGERQLIATLAQHVFGVDVADLPRLFEGAVFCRGVGRLRGLSCRAAEPRDAGADARLDSYWQCQTCR
jgi:hypothetical protein